MVDLVNRFVREMLFIVGATCNRVGETIEGLGLVSKDLIV